MESCKEKGPSLIQARATRKTANNLIEGFQIQMCFERCIPLTKVNNCQPRVLYTEKLSIKVEGETKMD